MIYNPSQFYHFALPNVAFVYVCSGAVSSLSYYCRCHGQFFVFLLFISCCDPCVVCSVFYLFLKRFHLTLTSLRFILPWLIKVTAHCPLDITIEKGRSLHLSRFRHECMVQVSWFCSQKLLLCSKFTVSLETDSFLYVCTVKHDCYCSLSSHSAKLYSYCHELHTCSHLQKIPMWLFVCHHSGTKQWTWSSSGAGYKGSPGLINMPH